MYAVLAHTAAADGPARKPSAVNKGRSSVDCWQYLAKFFCPQFGTKFQWEVLLGLFLEILLFP